MNNRGNVPGKNLGARFSCKWKKRAFEGFKVRYFYPSSFFNPFSVYWPKLILFGFLKAGQARPNLRNQIFFFVWNNG